MRPARLIVQTARTALDGQRGVLFLWCPVAFGLGIGAYFALRAEPGQAVWGAIAGLALVTAAALLRLGQRAPLLIALCLLLAGFAAAAFRTHMVAAPVLGFRYYGPIEGRIVAIDRSASDKIRLTLDRVVLTDVRPSRTPERVRIALHGQQGYIDPEPGLTVILTGHLAPPGGPVEPGGFDFQRQAWFKRLGAVGYTRTPVLAYAPAAEGRAGLLIHRARMFISAAVQDALPGRAGAFAAAITTGDRSGMDLATLESLRRSNLAHLLAISGLHMGMLTGFIFAATRYGLALFPYAALRWPLHRIGAIAALASGAVYLALSGGSVATERAYIMVSVMLMAVLFSRRAITLRAVALAAMIVLALRPEALLGPGFQMSFAATTALVAVFQGLRNSALWRLHPVLRWGLTLVISSAVAGLATAPVAAAHFNRVPHFGLVANLLAVPLMGSVVMPAAVLSAVLAPFGLGWIGLWLMRPAIEAILWTADRISGLDAAVSHVVAPSAPVLPLIALGVLFVILWQGRARWAGTLPVVLALVLWTQTERPTLLVSADAGLVGLMTPDGRALSKPKGSGFAASSWLENDGDALSQADAHRRRAFTGEKGQLAFTLGPARVLHITGRGAGDRAREACASADLVIAALDEGPPVTKCRLIARDSLKETGPLAIYDGKTGLRIVTTRDWAGTRPWNAQ